MIIFAVLFLGFPKCITWNVLKKQPFVAFAGGRDWTMGKNRWLQDIFGSNPEML